MAASRTLRIGLIPGDGIGREVIPVCYHTLLSGAPKDWQIDRLSNNDAISRPAVESSKRFRLL
ncbi:hypothetical protein CIHG_01767 [Coccidioides immitis H538.4]|uniref:Tartrate dehydrogenase n=1 Tax=Coccidioides immitis H538.4 TaxID=396776 RepID=A0A0J8UA58_COCIT|nr:hypothetical protein CIHG_01767 [Coccidioides immitis H538.4]